MRDAMRVLSEDGLELYCGDALSMLSDLDDGSVQCCVTSPPYWGLRDYGTATWSGGDDGCEHAGVRLPGPTDKSATNKGSSRDPVGNSCRLCGAAREDAGLGSEPTPEAYVAAMVAVFREVRRVLAKDGLLWLNLGDSYAGSWGNYSGQRRGNGAQREITVGSLPAPAWDGRELERPAASRPHPTLKPKDLIGIPWRVAFALQADGWYLRSDIIWSKPNPMPESVTDRPTKSHEYLFLLAKSQTYYFDQDAVREDLAPSSIQRINQPSFESQTGGEKDYANGVNGNRSARQSLVNLRKRNDRIGGNRATSHSPGGMYETDESGRNIRSVWTIATHPSPLPHFAAFPDALVEPCIKAGSRLGDTVLDPYAGTATTLKVARELGRKAIGIEISPDYCELAVKRLRYGVRGVMAIRDGQGVLE